MALIASSLSRAFSGRNVVSEASLTIEPGQVTTLIGQSGSGKTTFLRMLAGMERPDSGRVTAGELELSGPGAFLPVEKRRIGLVFQDFALFPHLTVLGNVMFGLQKLDKATRLTRADTWIERLGLSHRRDAYPHHLSGGEQQRTAIARALAPDPVAILLDEPFSGLDPAMREQVRAAALDAVRTAQIPALLVTHDAREALVHADKIAVIESGEILQTGTPDAVYRTPTSLNVARALGPMHEIAVSALPNPWRQHLSTSSDTVWYRPEAIQVGSGEALTVFSTSLAGPVTELGLTLSDGSAIFAACQPGLTLAAGEQVGVSINPDLFFDFA